MSVISASGWSAKEVQCPCMVLTEHLSRGFESCYLGVDAVEGTGCCKESATVAIRALSTSSGALASCPWPVCLGLRGLADTKGCPRGSVGWLDEGSWVFGET